MIVLSFSALLFYGALFVDDSYITLRYALNLVNGYGLRFNPQDLQPLEGYTNFGWLILQVPVLFFTTRAQIIFPICSFLSFFLTLYVLNRYLKADGWCISPPVVIMMAFHSFWFWNNSGLESGIMGAYLLLWNIMFLRWSSHPSDSPSHSSLWATVLLAVISLITRPDSVIVVAAHVLLLLLRKSIKSCFVYLTWVGSALFPYLLFKQVYFGSLLPNTFYAKSGFSVAVMKRGCQYVLGFSGFPELWVLFFCLIYLSAMVFFGKDRELVLKENALIPVRSALKLTVIILCGYVLYFIRVGGDYFPYYRFFYPLIPWFVFISSHLFLIVDKRRQVLIISAFVLVFFISTGIDSFDYALSFRTDNELSVVAAGYLKNHYPPGTVAVTAASGVVNYYCDFNSIDLYGLTDSRISRREISGGSNSMAGHDKYDIGLVQELKPKLIIPHLWVWGKTCPVDFRTSDRWLKSSSKVSAGVRALLAAPFLKDEYLPKLLPLSAEGRDFVYVIYERYPGAGK
jgi:hypothetical protein